MSTPLTIAEWKLYLRDSPQQAAGLIHRRLEGVSAATRRAAIATIEPREKLGNAFSQPPREGQVLSGIPYMLKDLFNLRGAVTGAGATFLEDAEGPAAEDCLLKQRLDGLGAVPVGRTQLNEFAYGLDGMNAHFGNCPHPHDEDRISGGSSSGSAWAIGRGVVPLAFGTDTGGSVRVPAALCGVYGVRLAPGPLSREGVFPLSRSFDSAGWFTRTARDAAEVWRALDDSAAPGNRERFDPARVLVVSAEELIDDPELGERYRRRRSTLGMPEETEAGRELAEWLRERRDAEILAYNVIVSTEAYAYHRHYLARWGDRYEERVRLLIERGARWSPEERRRAEEVRYETESRILAALESYHAIVLPATHTVAPPFAEAGQEFRRRILALTVPGSLARTPAVTLPVLREDGLSGGLQFLFHPKRSALAVDLLERLG